MSAPVKSAREALELWRKHDPAGLYDSLEEWQRRELLCVLRRVCDEVAARPVR